MRRSIAAAVLLAAVAAVSGACRFGGGSSSGMSWEDGSRLGFESRCPNGEGGCTEQALELVRPLLLELGAPFEGPGIVRPETNAAAPVTNGDVPTLPLSFTSDPPYEWRAEWPDNKLSGLTEELTIDLAPLAGGGDAYVVLADTNGAFGRFVVPADRARELLDALYVAADGAAEPTR